MLEERSVPRNVVERGAGRERRDNHPSSTPMATGRYDNDVTRTRRRTGSRCLRTIGTSAPPEGSGRARGSGPGAPTSRRSAASGTENDPAQPMARSSSMAFRPRSSPPRVLCSRQRSRCLDPASRAAGPDRGARRSSSGQMSADDRGEGRRFVRRARFTEKSRFTAVHQGKSVVCPFREAFTARTH